MAPERPQRNSGRRLRRTAPPTHTTPLTRTGPPARRTAPRRTTRLTAAGPAAASAAQRRKITGRPCLVSGIRAVDPAHLIPRSLAGCDAAKCVVALCRRHHHAYDAGALDLLPYLEPARRTEICDAVAHLGLIGAVRRLTGRRNVT